MTTMLEKAARAMFDSYVRLSGMDAGVVEPYWIAHKEGFLASARAALQAIREPSQEVLWAGEGLDSGNEDRAPADWHWRAMIDTILEGKA